MRAAGGDRLALDSKTVQWVVRENYAEPGTKQTLLKGVVPPKAGIRIHSKMHNGMVYLDGAGVRYRFDFGDELQVLPEYVPLEVYGLGKTRPRKPSASKTSTAKKKTSAQSTTAKKKVTKKKVTKKKVATKKRR